MFWNQKILMDLEIWGERFACTNENCRIQKYFEPNVILSKIKLSVLTPKQLHHFTVDRVAIIPSIMYTVSSPMVVDFWLLDALRLFKLLELILFDEMHGCCKCLCSEQYLSRVPGLTVQPSKFISNFDPEKQRYLF